MYYELQVFDWRRMLNIYSGTRLEEEKVSDTVKSFDLAPLRFSGARALAFSSENPTYPENTHDSFPIHSLSTLLNLDQMNKT